MSLPVGILRLATVISYDSATGQLEANLDMSNITINTETTKKIKIPFSFYSVGGLFIGGIPDPGTPIVVGQGEGKWYFVSYINNTPTSIKLKTGELVIQASTSTQITLNKNGNINIGPPSGRINVNTDSKTYLDNFDTKISLTEGHRCVIGPIKRDINPNKHISELSKLDSPIFDQFLIPIGLDPSASQNINQKSNSKNPPFIENRELVYEFLYSSNVSDELTESAIYGKSNQQKTQYTLPNRRKSRADTLSLTLLEPNFLMETVKGTVVDIFGNILDINRNRLPIGSNDFTIKSDGNKDKEAAYLKIRESQRKSIAYHFEINAKKDLRGKNGKLVLPNIDAPLEENDYARNRSRFFLDVDKEGLIKLNVPATSEVGNVPLLVRYENYSSFGDEDNNNPNKLFKRDDGLDIFLDSFAKNGGVISIEDENGRTTLQDRITKAHLNHGTAYHNILNTCQVHQSAQFISYPFEPLFDISSIPTYDPGDISTNIVSPKITVGGSNANAGGRSGSFNFDGSIELNVGANTIDRHSMWLDTAGSIIGNIGRDKRNISAAITMDGDLLLQVGGNGVVGDSRFNGLNNAFRPGAIDIRVFNAGFDCTLVRIDNEGVKVMTPGRMVFQSQGDMLFRSASGITMDAERFVIHEREVVKFPVTSV